MPPFINKLSGFMCRNKLPQRGGIIAEPPYQENDLFLQQREILVKKRTVS